MPNSRQSRRTFLRRTGAAIGTAAAWSAYSFGIEPDWLELTRHTVPIKDLPKAFDGFKIGLIADLHYPHFVDRDYVRRAFKMAMRERPDILCVPGDIYQEMTPVHKFPLTGIFDDFKPPHGILGSLGNHDCWCGPVAAVRAIQDHTPIKMLVNDHVIVKQGGQGLCFAGLPMLGMLPWFDMARTFRGIPPDMPRIALCHHPDFAEQQHWKDTRIDLLLAGHTHGGEIRILPNYAPVTKSRYGNKFREGLVEGKGFRVYVTRGLARPMHCRFLSRPEVTILTLKPGDA